MPANRPDVNFHRSFGAWQLACPVAAARLAAYMSLRYAALPEKWLELNAEYAKSWPNITVKRDAPADAKEFDGKPDKFEKFFSAEPGEGD